MTKRRLLMVVLGVGFGLLLARGMDLSAVMARFEPVAVPFALAIGIAGAAALCAGIVALITAGRRSHSAQMAHDDALRVIRMQQRKTTHQSDAKVIINTPPLMPEEQAPKRQASGDAAPSLQPVMMRTVNEKITIDDAVYFQPIIHVPSGAVSGFNVFRRLTNDNKRFRFVRYATHLSKSAQAKLEADGVMTATSEARRVLGRDKNGSQLWIDVPISEALLSDRVKLQSMLNLMSAHPALKRSIRLLVDGRALFKARKAVLDALKAVQREGMTMALNLSEAGRPPVNPELLAWFDVLYVSKADVQQAIMRQQADTSVAGANQTSAPEGSSLLGSLAEARRLNMTIIATNVVCEPDAVDMLAEEIELMTGDLLGEPRAIKAKLLAQPATRSTSQLNKTG